MLKSEDVKVFFIMRMFQCNGGRSGPCMSWMSQLICKQSPKNDLINSEIDGKTLPVSYRISFVVAECPFLTLVSVLRGK